MDFGHINLFKNIKKDEIEPLLSCLGTFVKKYQKGSFIFMSGENIKSFGIVLSGSVHIIKENFWGERAIVTEISEGEVFGEVYALLNNKVCEISAVAAQKCEILFINTDRILNTCSPSCGYHSTLIKNLMIMLAFKNLSLTQKIGHMSNKSTREKLMSYFSAEAIKVGSNDFYIPFNRQQLADYLSVERSAMSKELCRMRDEGFITFNKNHFHLDMAEDIMER